MEQGTRLNIGAGGTQIPGYTPWDIKGGQDARKLPFPDNTVDAIYASHVFEHFDRRESDAVLAEWVRALKPGGELKLAVPDLRKIASDLVSDPSQDDYLLAVTYGGQTDEHDRHGWGYTEPTLKLAMHRAGLGAVVPFEPFVDDCSRNPYSANLVGYKRWWEPVPRPKIAVVLSQPRFTFTGHAVRCMELCYQTAKRDRAELAIQQSWGAFWDRDIEAATGAVIQNHDPDFILYSDFDTFFTPDDVFTLLDTLNASPQLAGIGSVQMSRHDDFPLVFRPDLDYTGETTLVPFSHFGLTLIRADVFHELPHPWFWSVPGPDGSWGDWRRSDADITFWRIMREHGFRHAQHNRVIVGHGVECIKWPKPDGSGVILQPEADYFRNGKPKHVGFDGEVYRKRMLAKAGGGA